MLIYKIRPLVERETNADLPISEDHVQIQIVDDGVAADRGVSLFISKRNIKDVVNLGDGYVNLNISESATVSLADIVAQLRSQTHAASGTMSLTYYPSQICFDSLNRIGAHFFANPFIGGVPKTIFTEPVTVVASGMPYECQNGYAARKAVMRVSNVSVSTAGVFKASIFGTVISADPVHLISGVTPVDPMPSEGKELLGPTYMAICTEVHGIQAGWTGPIRDLRTEAEADRAQHLVQWPKHVNDCTVE